MTRDRRFGWRDRLRSLYLWHRYAGLTVALLALHLAVTGILLNHAHDLGFDRHYLDSDWLLDLYGVEAPPATGYRIGAHWYSSLGTQLYRDAQLLEAEAGPVVGAISQDGIVAVATPDTVLLLTPNGETVDRLATPAPATGLVAAAGKAVLITRQGRFAADPGFLGFTPSSQTVDAAAPQTPPAALRRQLERRYRGHLITEERFLRDLHSGRLLTHAGPWLVDLAGVLLCLLALSGIRVWWQRRKQRQLHRQHHRRG